MTSTASHSSVARAAAATQPWLPNSWHRGEAKKSRGRHPRCRGWRPTAARRTSASSGAGRIEDDDGGGDGDDAASDDAHPSVVDEGGERGRLRRRPPPVPHRTRGRRHVLSMVLGGTLALDAMDAMPDDWSSAARASESSRDVLAEQLATALAPTTRGGRLNEARASRYRRRVTHARRVRARVCSV